MVKTKILWIKFCRTWRILSIFVPVYINISQKIEHFYCFCLLIGVNFNICSVWLAYRLITKSIRTQILQVFVIAVYLLSMYFSVFVSESFWIGIRELSIVNKSLFFVIMFGIIKTVTQIRILKLIGKIWCGALYFQGSFSVGCFANYRDLQSRDFSVNTKVIKVGVINRGTTGIIVFLMWCNMSCNELLKVFNLNLIRPLGLGSNLIENIVTRSTSFATRT